MKVTISLPDPLFAAAEYMAEQLKVSRSQLYAQALAEYLSTRQASDITHRLNAVYADSQVGIDAALNKAQLSLLHHEAW